ERGVGQRRAAEVADERDVVELGLEVGAPVEGVDAIDVLEADPLQHLLHAAGLRTDHAEDLAGARRQEGRVDLATREELLDELLVLPAQAIRLLVGEAGEALADGLPEDAASIREQRR